MRYFELVLISADMGASLNNSFVHFVFFVFNCLRVQMPFVLTPVMFQLVLAGFNLHQRIEGVHRAHFFV